MTTDKIKELAEFMHEKYEEIAVKVGWETQNSCQTNFKDLPDENKTVMLVLAEEVESHIRKNIIDELKTWNQCTSGNGLKPIMKCGDCKNKFCIVFNKVINGRIKYLCSDCLYRELSK